MIPAITQIAGSYVDRTFVSPCDDVAVLSYFQESDGRHVVAIATRDQDGESETYNREEFEDVQTARIFWSYRAADLKAEGYAKI